MSVKEFCWQLNDAQLGKNDKKWFPAWLRRYASTVETVEGKLSVTEAEVIAFSRSLLAQRHTGLAASTGGTGNRGVSQPRAEHRQAAVGPHPQEAEPVGGQRDLP